MVVVEATAGDAGAAVLGGAVLGGAGEASVDLVVAPEGTPVKSSGSGTVVYCGWNYADGADPRGNAEDDAETLRRVP